MNFAGSPIYENIGKFRLVLNGRHVLLSNSIIKIHEISIYRNTIFERIIVIRDGIQACTMFSILSSPKMQLVLNAKVTTN